MQIREDARANATTKQKTWDARSKPGEFDFGAVMAAAVTEIEVTSWRNANTTGHAALTSNYT